LIGVGESPSYLSSDNAVNNTVSRARVTLLLCPSDRGAFDETGCNYRGSTGVGPRFAVFAETLDSGNGLFPEVGMISPALVPDGLSHTVAVSERIRGSGRAGPPVDPTRDVFEIALAVFDADELLSGCRISARATNAVFTSSGRWWFWTGRERTLFNHAQPPNGKIPDCLQGLGYPAPGLATARSFHTRGLNALMGDGSVRYVADRIATSVWRGLGTRNGGELVD
jgi:prepilin-type processing-associated H-X9-DG protein